MMDRETQRPRGYGFVTYDNDSTVEKLLSMPPLIMDGKMVRLVTSLGKGDSLLNYLPFCLLGRGEEGDVSQCRWHKRTADKGQSH